MIILANNECRVEDDYTYRGMRVLYLENQFIKIGILVDKGSDIFQLIYKPLDLDLMWRSPIGWRPPHSFLPTTHSSTSSFMDSFGGGWQECFPSGGPYTELAGASIGLHGEVTLLPWQYRVIKNSPQKVQVELSVKTIRTPFLLKKIITIEAGTSYIQFNEQLTNLGHQPLPYMWGHHPAFGPPFLSPDCWIDIPATAAEAVSPEQDQLDSELAAGGEFVWPRLINKKGRAIDGRKVGSSRAKTHDLLFLKELTEGWLALTNRQLKVGLGLRFDPHFFRYVWFWRVFGGGSGYPWYRRAYTVALEPWTSYPNQGIAAAIKNQTAAIIGPGQSVATQFEAVFYQGYRAVNHIGKNGQVKGAS